MENVCDVANIVGVFSWLEGFASLLGYFWSSEKKFNGILPSSAIFVGR